VEVGDHLFDMQNNFFQSCFVLRFQEIKLLSLFGHSVDNKLGIRDDTQRGERAARKNIRRARDTSCSEVESPRSLARRVKIVCNTGLNLDKQNGNFSPGNKVYHSEIDRAGDAFELRSNLVNRDAWPTVGLNILVQLGTPKST
jgi:hypothetical protein